MVYPSPLARQSAGVKQYASVQNVIAADGTIAMQGRIITIPLRFFFFRSTSSSKLIGLPCVQ